MSNVDRSTCRCSYGESQNNTDNGAKRLAMENLSDAVWYAQKNSSVSDILNVPRCHLNASVGWIVAARTKVMQYLVWRSPSCSKMHLAKPQSSKALFTLTFESLNTY